MIALIDGDEIAHKVSCMHTQDIDWDGGTAERRTYDLNECIREAVKMIKEWVDLSRCERPIVCFSDDLRARIFRKKLLPSYKSNHTSEKPEQFWPVVEYIRNNYECKMEPGLEADDLLGLYGTHPSIAATVCSQDKDMETLPARWYNPRLKRSINVRIARANGFLFKQAVMGDRTDGYMGIPRVGEIGAGKLLAGIFTEAGLWAAVRDAYLEAGLTEEDALTQVRCARILRHGDYDFELKRVRLWHPTDNNLWIDAKEIPECTSSNVPAASTTTQESPPASGRRGAGRAKTTRGSNRKEKP